MSKLHKQLLSSGSHLASFANIKVAFTPRVANSLVRTTLKLKIMFDTHEAKSDQKTLLEGITGDAYLGQKLSTSQIFRFGETGAVGKGSVPVFQQKQTRSA